MNATETDCIVNVNNIYKNFGALQVLKGVSCRVKKGERIVLIGPSGSGKSTLLRCMNLLEKPTYGEVWLDGKLVTPVDPYLHPEIIEKSKTYAKMLAAGEIEKSELVHEIKAKDLLHEKHEGAEYNKAIKSLYKENVIDINLARRKMGMVFQHFNLFNNLTVMQNMTLAPVKLKLKTKEEAEQSALKLLQRIGLEDKKDVYPSTLYRHCAFFEHEPRSDAFRRADFGAGPRNGRRSSGADERPCRRRHDDGGGYARNGVCAGSSFESFVYGRRRYPRGRRARTDFLRAERRTSERIFIEGAVRGF